MFNLLKKIQGKGRNLPPAKEATNVSLSPQYNGPLRSFNPNASELVPLEKCRLNIADIHDIYQNEIAYTHFKMFLEFKMCEELLHLHNLLLFGYEGTNQSPQTEAQVHQPGSSTVNGCQAFSADIFNNKLSKLPEDIRLKMAMHGVRAIKKESTIDLAVISNILRNFLSEYLLVFNQSEWHLRYQVEFLTSRSVLLGDILGHQTAKSYFMQFLELEDCSTIVEFWSSVCNFKQNAKNIMQSEQVDFDVISNDALIFYEKYLSLATNPLGFNDEIRNAVEEALCDENNRSRIDCFDPAVNIVLAFLRQNYLPSFLSSQHYVHLITELICNSSSTGNQSPVSSISDYDIRKSPILKFDPHSLWNSRKMSGLSFGHIDQLGRFQSDIEPDPDRINQSKLSKMMRKWAHKGANKAEEEMAWQVAEMVIKDITDLTMGGAITLENSYCDSENNTKNDGGQ